MKMSKHEPQSLFLDELTVGIGIKRSKERLRFFNSLAEKFLSIVNMLVLLGPFRSFTDVLVHSFLSPNKHGHRLFEPSEFIGR